MQLRGAVWSFSISTNNNETALSSGLYTIQAFHMVLYQSQMRTNTVQVSWWGRLWLRGRGGGHLQHKKISRITGEENCTSLRHNKLEWGRSIGVGTKTVLLSFREPAVHQTERW